MMVDTVVIGAGVVGCMIARELSRYQGHVLLLEAENDVSCGASRANSGIIHGGYDAKAGSLKARLARAGNQAFDALEQELNFGFRRLGSLVLAYAETEVPQLRSLMANGACNGVDDLRLVTDAELDSLQPGLPPTVVAGLFCPSAGIASPYELTIALAENAVDNGVELRLNHPVEAIEKVEGGWELHSPAGRVRARTLVNCAGNHSDVVARMVGDDSFRIIHRRGDYLVFDRSYQHAVKRVLFRCPSVKGKGVLLSPTVHGNLLLGPNAHQVDNAGHPEPTLAGLQELVTQGEAMFPGMDYRQAVRAFSGLRSTPDSKDFIIEPSKTAAGVFHVAGIESPGLTASPAIARYLLAQLQQAGRLGERRSDFCPRRRAMIRVRDHADYLSPDQLKFYTGLASGHPDRMVCRCEQVSEGVILDILARSTPVLSVAAMKRRSRAGMGRCQGAFCSARVSDLIRQHTGLSEVPPDNQQARTLLAELKKKMGG